MFRRAALFLLLLFTLFLFESGLAQESNIPTKITEEALEFNQAILDDMLKKDVDVVLSKALDKFQELKGARSGLEKLMVYLPDYKDGKTYTLMSSQVRITADTKTPEAIYKTAYEITDINGNKEFTDKWAILDLYSQETSEGLKFRHFNFKTYSSQPTKIGKFEIKNKGFKHYIFLALLIAIPLFVIFTIVAIIRNKHMSKKWLWGLFSSVGLWGVNFNWMTGKISPEFITLTTNSNGSTGWHLKILSFKVLGASSMKASQYSPYIVTIAFPIGAVLYWILKHRNKIIYQEFE